MFGSLAVAFPRDIQPIRTTFAGCCARAASGQAAAAPPTRLRNSRRLMSAPWLRSQHRIGSNEYFDRGLKPASLLQQEVLADVRSGAPAACVEYLGGIAYRESQILLRRRSAGEFYVSHVADV